MDTQEKYSLEEAHEVFARQTNGKAWKLLGKAGRTAAEDDETIEAAYASSYHWRSAGTGVNLQRGAWLIAHVYTVLGEAKPALLQARRCLELTEQHKDQMKDFDVAYAYEGMSRALALNGEMDEATKFLPQAQAAGEAIAGAEDRQIFLSDLNSGDWYGIG
jgi:hypothetical protein